MRAYRQSREDEQEVPEAGVEAVLALRGVHGQELEQLAVHLAVHELKRRHIRVGLQEDGAQGLWDYRGRAIKGGGVTGG